HHRPLAGAPSARAGRRLHPADRRRAAGRAPRRTVGHRHAAGPGRAGGSARHRRTRARDPGAGAAAGRQQPQPAQFPGLARHHAVAARRGAARPAPGDRERHPCRRGRRAHARSGHRRLPGRRGLHARTRSGTGAARPVLPGMSTAAGQPSRVVFDFDHTLYDGDSGSHLFAWLIRRSWWRTALALLAAPVFGPMVAFLPTRRYGISGFVWIGTVGMPGPPTLDDAIDRYVAGHEAQIRARLLPVALDVLHRHREAGDRVVVATGAPPELARAILAFVAHEAVPVTGTLVGPRLGAIVAVRHCHAEEKMRMLRELGHGAIDVAYS